MANSGWIIVSRSLMGHWVWVGERFSRGQAWIDLLMMAGYQESKVPWNGSLITVPRGGIVTSQLKLAERWQWNRKSVALFLGNLKQDGMIEYQATKQFTKIWICNFCAFQDRDGTTGGTTGRTTDRTTDRTSDWTTDRTYQKKDNKNNKLNKANNSLSSRQILELYTRLCPNLPAGGEPNDGCGADLETLREAFGKANASSYLAGNNARGWKADLGWLTRTGNLEKVLAGKYDDAKPLEDFYRMAREFGDG